MLKKAPDSRSAFLLFDDNDSHQIISPFEDKKVLTDVECADCHVKGMAFVNPKESRPHYCCKHNPSVQEAIKKLNDGIKLKAIQNMFDEAGKPVTGRTWAQVWSQKQ